MIWSVIIYTGYKYTTDAQLCEDTGELIKEGVKWIGKAITKGAQWTSEKISEWVSAIAGYFSKGKNKKREVPAEDRDAIAKHSHERGHGEENDLNLPTKVQFSIQQKNLLKTILTEILSVEGREWQSMNILNRVGSETGLKRVVLIYYWKDGNHG